MSLEEDDAENGSFVPIALARRKVLLGSAVLTFFALVFVLLALRA